VEKGGKVEALGRCGRWGGGGLEFREFNWFFLRFGFIIKVVISC
jgi:hypothetical protein